MYKDLYEMDMNELYNTLVNRRKGLAYELWRQAELNRGVLAKPEEFPQTPEEGCPDLYPPKKTYKMPDFLKKKYYEREAKK